MKVIIVSYRRGRHTVTPNQAILKVSDVNDKKTAYKFVGRKVVFKTGSGKLIRGVVTAIHGGNGRLRARFVRGLPGQAIGEEVSLS